MDRKSDFKECPKCGLRNKPSATQCDFCGQNLGASDDWQQHVKDLESLNKMELRRPLDDRTSRRIESTIIRKDAPSTRNMEIREAGNIGMVLKDLDQLSAKDKAGDIKGERSHQAPVQDKLRIKEVNFIPSEERDVDVTPLTNEGATIADVLNGPAKDDEVAATIPETQSLEEPSSLETPPEVKVDEPAKEQVERLTQEPKLAQLPDVTEERISEAEEELLAEEGPEKPEEPKLKAEEENRAEKRSDEPITAVAASGPSDVVVPANEVTLEAVQPLPEQAPSTEISSGEEQNITSPSNDSHETIKLKLVEVERPKVKLTPMALERSTPRSTLTAMAILGIGTVAYLLVLLLIAVGLLGTAAGLGGGAVSSFMMIFGAAVVYPYLRKKNGTEVYICPKCHEKVGKSSDGCPACGAEFESED